MQFWGKVPKAWKNRILNKTNRAYKAITGYPADESDIDIAVKTTVWIWDDDPLLYFMAQLSSTRYSSFGLLHQPGEYRGSIDGRQHYTVAILIAYMTLLRTFPNSSYDPA